MKKQGKIPTIKLGAQVPAKSKKAKPKTKAKKGKRGRKPAPGPVPDPLSQVPASMAPPLIPDSRPVFVPEPEPEQTPSVPEPAIGEPDFDVAPVTVAEMESAQPANQSESTGNTVETRLVQGETCTWIGALEDAPDDPDKGKPVCPHCKGTLIYCPERALIELGLEQYELGAYDSVNPPPRRHPGYKDLLHWVMERSHEQCWPTIELAADAYHTATGKLVDPRR